MLTYILKRQKNKVESEIRDMKEILHVGRRLACFDYGQTKQTTGS
jgi:hypothetical protein